jgi:acyl-CoA synthetase (AMP-forming)/AMP-acid ligase II
LHLRRESAAADVGRRWKERYGVDVLDGIGSTEMLHIFISNYPGEVKYGTTGKPVPGYDIRLVDDDGNVITSQGEMGELQVRGPTGAIMYWNNREKTRETFLGNGRAPATSTCRTRTAISFIAAAATTCSRSAASMCRRSRSRARSAPIPMCWRPRWSPWPDEDELIKPKASWSSSRRQGLRGALRARCRST